MQHQTLLSTTINIEPYNYQVRYTDYESSALLAVNALSIHFRTQSLEARRGDNAKSTKTFLIGHAYVLSGLKSFPAPSFSFHPICLQENQLCLKAQVHPTQPQALQGAQHLAELSFWVSAVSQKRWATPYLGWSFSLFPAQAVWVDKVCHLGTSLKCLQVDAAGEIGEIQASLRLSPILLLVGTMVPLLLANDGVGSLDRNPRWGSHSIMTPLFLG